MSSNVAALWGTSVGYSEFGDYVTIETVDGRVAALSITTFEFLYHRLDKFTAALKEDCIEFTVITLDKCIQKYPEWFRQAMYEGWVTNKHGTYIFLDRDGEVAMDSEAIMLRNFKGELMYMDVYTFAKYYDILGE